MTTKRTRAEPQLVYAPRSSLQALSYAPIDSALKDLKTSSRRLNSSFLAFRDETHILERLYYKGKNQHRSAIFWKRVLEVRRYARRLDEMQIPKRVDHLRCTFFGESASR